MASPAALRVQVDRRHDWFGMAGFGEINGSRVELAVLLDAARRDQRFAKVDEGKWVELDQTLRAQLAALADHAFSHRGQTELSPGAVLPLKYLSTVWHLPY